MSPGVGDAAVAHRGHRLLSAPALVPLAGPGLSREMTVMVAVAGTVLAVGLVVLAAGVFVYCRQPRAQGELSLIHI